MSTNVDITLSFHGETFLELAQGETTVFFDPVFSAPARGRRQTSHLRKEGQLVQSLALIRE